MNDDLAIEGGIRIGILFKKKFKGEIQGLREN